MPVTLHQPLPSHWYISEARRLYPSRSKLASLEFGRQSAPSAPIGPSHIRRALDRRRAQSATAFSFAPTAACCSCQTEDSRRPHAALEGPMLILSMGAAAAQRRTIFFEVGANNGNFSAELLARRASNRAHVDEVYLFEPNPRFARELALLHGRYGATHVQKAAWVEDGHKTFYFSRNDEASSLVGGAKRHKSAATVHDAWTKMPCRPAAEYAASTAYAALERAWDGTIARRAASLQIQTMSWTTGQPNRISP